MLIASEVTEIVRDVDIILKTTFSKSIYYPKPDDQMRLLRLRIWSERYKVSLQYIVERLVPYYAYIIKKRTSKDSKGIGTTISVFTGSAAEAFIVESIKKDFPNGENIVEWDQERQSEAIAILSEDKDLKPKGILRYKSLADYREAYEKRIDKQRVITAKLVREISKQPYRGNPFRG